MPEATTDVQQPWLSDDSNTALAELVYRSAMRDSAAFERLYRLTSAQLFAVLLRLLKDPELAQDALQDAFISVWRQAASYRPDRGLAMSWLVSIARYRALDLLRRSQRRASLLRDGLEETPDTDPRYDPAASTGLAADTLRLGDCIKQLSQGQQQSIRLAFLDGCTHEEVAGVLRAPLGTVKSWIRRGLAALRACLER